MQAPLNVETRIADWQILEEYPSRSLAREWLQFLAESNYPSLYTSPLFFRMPYWDGKRPFAVLGRDKGRLVIAACGTVEEREVRVGLPVRPQVALASDLGPISPAEGFQSALASLGGGDGKLITIYSAGPIPGLTETGFRESIASAGDRVVMLDLRQGKEEVMMGFSASRRANIRKAIRRNILEVRELCGEEDLVHLYRIHREWCRTKGIVPDTWKVFSAAKKMGDGVKVFVALKESEIVAGSYFRFIRNGIVEYSGNNSIREARRDRPNDLLMWKAIEWACDNGFTKFCMGASHPFLQRFGGTIESSYRYRRDRTFFRRHDAKEAISNTVLNMYHAIPGPARLGVKRMVGRGR